MGSTQHTKLPYVSEWTPELLRMYIEAIREEAEAFGLDTYRNQYEIIRADQMMDAYASIGLPVFYHHWSFGKHFLETKKRYQHGQMGLAYEIVINSDPCLVYLMEENTLAMQALVIAHAAYGHNSFFKGNYLFQQWTDPKGIVDYMLFARKFITQCEEHHGEEAVEAVLDACHALMSHGVFRYKHPTKLSPERELARLKERMDYEQMQYDRVFEVTRPRKEKKVDKSDRRDDFLAEPQENLLYFVEKHAPLLEPWQREVVRIVRKVAQYFFPQRQTQVMNEGWACFWHYTIINSLYDAGRLEDGFMLEFLRSHTSVVYQPNYNDPWFNGINPYHLGYHMWMDLKRICTGIETYGNNKGKPCTPEQIAEDRACFPQLVDTDWRETFDFVMQNHKDESFIQQYLSPRLMREIKLFMVLDSPSRANLVIEEIANEEGYRPLRELFSRTYDLVNREPRIEVVRVNRRSDRSLWLGYYPEMDRGLEEDTLRQTMAHMASLWGFLVKLYKIPENFSTTRVLKDDMKMLEQEVEKRLRAQKKRP
ncbi:MAG TPA: SpoVR family protein [Candidatus Paceibacterota bacterium]|nr:SpoVR family protein [Candidatus Paceibacterota bacterium]